MSGVPSPGDATARSTFSSRADRLLFVCADSSTNSRPQPWSFSPPSQRPRSFHCGACRTLSRKASPRAQHPFRLVKLAVQPDAAASTALPNPPTQQPRVVKQRLVRTRQSKKVTHDAASAHFATDVSSPSLQAKALQSICRSQQQWQLQSPITLLHHRAAGQSAADARVRYAFAFSS